MWIRVINILYALDSLDELSISNEVVLIELLTYYLDAVCRFDLSYETAISRSSSCILGVFELLLLLLLLNLFCDVLLSNLTHNPLELLLGLLICNHVKQYC